MSTSIQSQRAYQSASKLLTKKVETKLLAICDITGIAITIEAPALGYALTYQNPLSLPSNFLELASLPFNDLQKLEAPILAGLVLAVLKNWEMIDCNHQETAAQQNLLLQTVAPYFLISYLRFFATSLSSHKTAYSYLPKLSLHSPIMGEPKTVSLYSSMKEHLESCKEILYPSKDTEELADIYEEIEEIASYKKTQNNKRIAEAILRARRSKEMQQKELLKKGRDLTKDIKESGILSDKLIAFLQILFSSDYLVTAEESTKQRAIEALNKYQNPLAHEIAAIIKNDIFKETISSIFTHHDDVEVEEDLEAVEAELPTTPSNSTSNSTSLASILKARLAAMKAGKTLPPSTSQE